MTQTHIVHYEFGADHILTRLIRFLTDKTGWTAGTAPNPQAQLNLFFPYLVYSEKFPDWKLTPIAAYFSHLDTNQIDKANKWHDAARCMDLCIVTAPQYGTLLKQWGRNVAFAHAPVDPQFKPGPKPYHNQPVVGVSGYTYRDGRKGQHLIHQLVQSEWGQTVTWKATGRGWPVPNLQAYDWKDMHRFYQGLDVYVCASMIEGVPMPPLEALATGVRIVIPRGVGMLDELPDLPDIYRFESGNYADFERAVQAAVADKRPTDVAACVAAVADYTPQQWVADHLNAFEKLLNPPIPIEVNLPKPTPQNAGVFYVAYGDPARLCAKRAMATFKQHMPLPVALAADSPIGGEDVLVKHADTDTGARAVKTQIYDLAPADWLYVLYLDADTEVVADISFLYDVLADGWELVICKNPSRFHTTRNMVRPNNKQECQQTFEAMGSDDMIQWNGGVFAFRRCARTEVFFRAWHAEWNKWASRDQAALLRAMWKHPLRVYTLGAEWNTSVSRENGEVVKRYDEPEITAGILHFPTEARRVSGPLLPEGVRNDSAQAWGQVKK